jgi:hypothetical protein
VPHSAPSDAARKLINSLYVEAGRIMEDASPELALRMPTEGNDVDDRLKRGRLAGEDIAKLIAAAEVLRRRYIEG